MENNNQTPKKGNNKTKQNIFMLTGALALVITGAALGGVVYKNTNQNDLQIKNLKNENNKWQEEIKNLKKANEEQNEALKKQLESDKKALQDNLATKATTKALNDAKKALESKLTIDDAQLEDKLDNNDLTEAFNKLFKAKPEYATELKNYQETKLKAKQEYINALNAYKIKKFGEKSEYNTIFNVWKGDEIKLKSAFIKTQIYQDLLKTQNQKLVTDFKKTNEYKTALNTYKMTEFKKAPGYTTDLNEWRNSEIDNQNAKIQKEYHDKKQQDESFSLSFEQFKKTHKDKLPTDQNPLNLLFSEDLFAKTEKSKAALKAIPANDFEKTDDYINRLNAYKVKEFEKTQQYIDVFNGYKTTEFRETDEYKTKFVAFTKTKTNEEWSTEFSKTDEYKTEFDTLKATKTNEEWNTAFIKTKEYKNALIKYVFSFKDKLEAQKAELTGVIDTKLTASELLTKINELTFDVALKNKLAAALVNEFGQYTKSTELTQAKLTELLNNVFARKDFALTEDQKTAIKNHLNNDQSFKDAIKGDKGEDGINGKDGAPGAKGKDGAPGTTPDTSNFATKADLEQKIDITKLNDYVKANDFINKLIKVLDNTKATGTSEEVKAVINQLVEKKLIKIAFDKVVKEFQTNSDISQQTGRELHNKDEKSNSFYKLAPFLFQSVAKANEKLNELLEGNISNKKDKLAIWEIENGNWIIGKFNDLKEEKGTDGKAKYKKLIKVVFKGNTWAKENSISYQKQEASAPQTSSESVE